MLSESQSPDIHDPIAEKLDHEITSLQAQITELKAQRAIQASTILASRRAQQTLASLRAAQSSTSQSSSSRSRHSSLHTTDLTPLATHAQAQTTHNTTNLYRTLSSITTFHVTDPDPHAVDDGHVLGLRFDVCVSHGRFTKPYYIMLNKPFGRGDDGSGGGEEDDSRAALLRVHRHTLPPCIPLAALTRRYLPHDKGAVGVTSTSSSTASAPDAGEKRQDLRSFVRAIRRELVTYHKRVATIKDLRREFALDEKPSRKGKERDVERVIADVSAADAEARQLRLEWVDGRIGRVLVDDGGAVLKCVVIGEEGRDREVERRILGGGVRGGDGQRSRMEDIGERLREGIY